MFKPIDELLFIIIATTKLWKDKKPMCEPRHWTRLYSEALTEVEDGIIVCLIGERSDFETFKVAIKLSSADSTQKLAEKVKKGFETLESYRTCDCHSKVGECIKHISSVSLPTQQSTKSTNLISRR